MAFWVLGAGSSLPCHDPVCSATGSARDDCDVCFRDDVPRLNRNRGAQTTSIAITNLAFLVIRESRNPSPSPSPLPPLPPPPPSPPPPTNISIHGFPAPHLTQPSELERTASGHCIASSPTAQHALAALSPQPDQLSDSAAFRLVRSHFTSFRRRWPDSQPERILRALVSPRRPGCNPQAAAAILLDDDALCSLFSAANELFFAGRLAGRVAWDWSHPTCAARYATCIVGTTALRRCARLGGWETLIVLSAPLLRDAPDCFDRRLLIATFLHEMIHSFLFITCGLAARRDGGHTPAFRLIARLIDDWAGPAGLHLCDMEADLDRYRGDDAPLEGREPNGWWQQPRALDGEPWRWRPRQDEQGLHTLESPYVY